MPYRDAIDAAHARIAALESELAQLRGVDSSTPTIEQIRGELAHARQSLESLRKSGEEQQERLASERDRAWAALEACLEVERHLWRSRAESEVASARADADAARERFALMHEENVQLRDRIDRLDAEVTALLDSPARAALHYRQAIARTRAAIRSIEAERARLEAGQQSSRARLDALDARRAACGRELERLERALTRCSA